MNRTRNLLARIVLPQPTAPPRYAHHMTYQSHTHVYKMLTCRQFVFFNNSRCELCTFLKTAKSHAGSVGLWTVSTATCSETTGRFGNWFPPSRPQLTGLGGSNCENVFLPDQTERLPLFLIMKNDKFSGTFYSCGDKAEEKTTKIQQTLCQNKGEALCFVLCW